MTPAEGCQLRLDGPIVSTILLLSAPDVLNVRAVERGAAAALQAMEEAAKAATRARVGATPEP
jgi:hypothetical protein